MHTIMAAVASLSLAMMDSLRLPLGAPPLEGLGINNVIGSRNRLDSLDYNFIPQ
jgi:hypothetical protein